MLCCALFGLFIFHNTCVLFLSILDTAGADDEHTSSVRRHAQSAVMQPLKVLPAFLCWNLCKLYQHWAPYLQRMFICCQTPLLHQFYADRSYLASSFLAAVNELILVQCLSKYRHLVSASSRQCGVLFHAYCKTWSSNFPVTVGCFHDNNKNTPCLEKKRTNSILGITSSNTDRFTNFFHLYNLLEICNTAVIKYPIAPKTRHYTILWNINVRKLACPERCGSLAER